MALDPRVVLAVEQAADEIATHVEEALAAGLKEHGIFEDKYENPDGPKMFREGIKRRVMRKLTPILGSPEGHLLDQVCERIISLE